MALNKIKNNASWGESASSLNSNFESIEADLTKVKNATTRCKGYFISGDELKTAYPSSHVGDYAYIGTAYPFYIWKWNGSSWGNTGNTGGDQDVNLENYYNKTETDAKLSELGSKLIELKGFSSSADALGLQVGEYYYNTNTNGIRYRHEENNTISVPYVKGAVYLYQGTLYRWDFDNQQLRPISNGLLNVNTLQESFKGNYYTIEEAISAVPINNRRPLQLISYRTADRRYEYAQYLASDTSDTYWFDLTRWKVVLKSNFVEDVAFVKSAYNSLNINSWIGTPEFYTLEQAIALVPLEMRRTGLKLTFRTTINSWETAIFVVSDVSDEYWLDTSKWQVYNNTSFVNVNDITETQTTYYSLEQAIALVPNELRCGGCVITFRISKFERKMYQYIPAIPSDADWNNLSHWAEIQYVEGLTDIKNFLNGDDSIYFSIEGQISKADGSVMDGTSSYVCTPYLPVQVGLIIYGNEGSTASRCAFYDKDFNFISSLNIEATNGANVETILTDENIPTDAVYFRATGSKLFQQPSPFIKGWKYQSVINSLGLANELMLKNKSPKVKWMALGDSITQGYYSDNIEPYYHLDPTKSYCKYIEKLNGWELNNKAIGGTGYICKGPRGTSTNGKELVDTLDFSNTDLVTIAYGVNDWKYNEPLGSMEDDISVDSIIPAMRYVIEKIISSNPLTKIVVITPINCAVGGDESTNYGLGYRFSNNGTLEDIFNAMVEVCEYYGIEYVDMTHSSIFNRKNLLSLLLDKVHPTIPSLEVMGRELAAKISFK